MDDILKHLRPLLAKLITRGVLWVLVTVLGMAAMEADAIAVKFAEGAIALLLAVIAVLLDRYHHSADLAEKPK